MSPYQSPSTYALRPEDAAAPDDLWRPRGRIPASLRAFGKFLDTSKLAPGDLILTQDLNPGAISQRISKVQQQLGYASADSQWTHAALYLGDGSRLMEATFDSAIRGGSVRVSFVYDYCGEHALRVRRPKHVPATPDGWLIAVEAAMGIGQKYDFLAALSLFWEARSIDDGHWSAESRTYISPGVLCSTFYADCYGKVTGRSLGDSGVCVPATLSVSEAFDDLSLQWLTIG